MFTQQVIKFKRFLNSTYQDDITDEELVELLLTGDREKINNI